MENASKALLIAASVLIVILLIAFGMKIFKEGSEPVDEIDAVMSTTEKATFNSKFSAYAGNSKSAVQVKALADTIIANNSANKHEVKIKVLDNNATSEATTISSYVADLTGKYNITISEYSNGYISLITIS